MGSATIFSGGYAKVLAANGIKLKDDTLVMHGSIDPTITNPSAPDGSVYLSDYGLFNRVGGVWVKISDKIESFIKNSSFETDASGWLTYADTASSSPADGTGGVASVTIARSTTLPLSGVASGLFTKDAVNRQGQGFSYDFTIDNASKGKVLALRFDYQIASGTYANGDLSVWVYDVTNASMIQPAPTQIQNSGIIETFLGEFQSSIDSNSYRLIVHVSSTSASAYTVKFDNFYVGRAPKVYGSVTTDWVTYTPAPSITTNATHSGRWRKVGDKVEVSAKTVFSGTNTQGNLTMALPSGMSIDTTKIISGGQNLGVGLIYDASADVYYDTQVFVLGTTIYMTRGQVSAPPFARTDLNTPITYASGDEVYWNFSVPIAGWSSSQQLSNDADTRVVAAIINGNPANATANNYIIFPTVIRDTHGGYNTSTGLYTVKVTGFYRVTAAIYGAFGTGALICAVDGLGQSPAMGFHFSDGRSSGSTVVYARAGQTIGVYSNVNVSSLSSFNGLTIERISGPSQIAASESVIARYTQSSGQSIPNVIRTIVDFNTKDIDTHNAVTIGASWKFTAPISGVYRVSSNLFFAASAWSVGNVTFIDLYKNGAAFASSNDRSVQSSFTGHYGPDPISTTIRLNQGDYFDIRIYQSRGSSITLYSSSQFNYVSIERIGNY